jgi:zinc protease
VKAHISAGARFDWVSPRRFSRVALVLAAALAACVTTRQEVLAPDPAIRYGELENGMHYVILKNATPAGESAIRFCLNVGSINEADDQRGLAHLLEHMAFNGSAHIPRGELIPLLQREGLAFGADANAYTTPEQTVYSLDLPRTTAPTIESSLFVLREVASELTLASDAIERERGVVAAEARLAETAEFSADQGRMRFFFPKARFVDRLPIGDADTVAHAPPERVRAFYRDWYRPQNAKLVFIGDADPDLVEKAIVRAFSGWRSQGSAPPVPDRGFLSRSGVQFGFQHQPGAATNVLIASVLPARNEIETQASRFRSLLLQLANNIVNQRLARRFQDGSAPFTSASFAFDRVYHVADMETISVGTGPTSWDRALAASEQELRRALQHGFTRSEVSRWLAATQEDLEWGARVADKRTTQGYAFALMYADRMGRIFTHPRDDLAMFEAERSRITVDALNAAFREAWSRGPRIYVTSGAPVADGDGAVRQAYEASRRVAVAAEEDRPLPPFAYENFGDPGRVVGREVDPSLGIASIRFANNVRLNVRQTAFDADRVHIKVSIRGGFTTDMPQGRGWQEAFMNGFIAGGLVAQDVLTLDQIRGGRLANTGWGTRPDGITLTGEASEGALLFQLQSLCAYVTAPAFRPAPMVTFRKQIEDNYDTRSGTAFGALEQQFWGILTSNSPYLTSASKEELLSWTSERLRALVSPILDQGAIEIGVVGSARVDDVVDAVARTFGALPPRAFTADQKSDHGVIFAKPSAQPIVIHHSGKATQAVAAIYWPTTDDSDARRDAVLNLTAGVLRLRMLERLREQEGASYAPSAGNHASHFFKDFGYFVAAVDAPPDRTARMLQLIDEVVASVTKSVSQDELDRARNPRLERIRASLEDDLSWMDAVSVAQSEPETVAAWQHRSERYLAVTIDDVKQAASTYLNPATAIRVMVLPPAP